MGLSPGRRALGHSPFLSAHLRCQSTRNLSDGRDAINQTHVGFINYLGHSKVEHRIGIWSRARANAGHCGPCRAICHGTASMTTPIAPHITAFFEHVCPRNAARARTPEILCVCFSAAFNLCKQALPGVALAVGSRAIDAPLVLDFLNDLETHRGNGPSSRNIRLAAIRSFMHFLEYRVHRRSSRSGESWPFLSRKPSQNCPASDGGGNAGRLGRTHAYRLERHP